ncbi:MAG: anchor protein [Chthoniobacteraceae bacterium]|nr:anchor protein [Chthoniobacteraceae bacterium]
MKIPPPFHCVKLTRHSTVWLPVLAGVIALALAPAGNAALLVYEGFNYSAGDLQGNNGGLGWEDAGWNNNTNAGTSTTSADVVSGSLGYGSLITNGNSASLANVTTNTAIFRDFATTLGDTAGSIWLSFLIDGTTINCGAGLFSGGTEQVFMGTTTASSPTANQYAARYKFGAATNQPITTGADAAPTLGANSNTGVHFMVLQLDSSGASPIFRAWLDPDQSSLGFGFAPTGGTTAMVSANTRDFTSTSFRLGEFSTGTLNIDEIRIGTAWADVSPVPEPTAALLVAVGALGLCGFRRRTVTGHQ